MQYEIKTYLGALKRFGSAATVAAHATQALKFMFPDGDRVKYNWMKRLRWPDTLTKDELKLGIPTAANRIVTQYHTTWAPNKPAEAEDDEGEADDGDEEDDSVRPTGANAYKKIVAGWHFRSLLIEEMQSHAAKTGACSVTPPYLLMQHACVVHSREGRI